MATNKSIMQLNRTEIIDQLRGHVEPRMFHVTLLLPTADLRSRLAYHLSPEHEKRDGGRGLPADRGAHRKEVIIIELAGV